MRSPNHRTDNLTMLSTHAHRPAGSHSGGRARGNWHGRASVYADCPPDGRQDSKQIFRGGPPALPMQCASTKPCINPTLPTRADLAMRHQFDDIPAHTQPATCEQPGPCRLDVRSIMMLLLERRPRLITLTQAARSRPLQKCPSAYPDGLALLFCFAHALLPLAPWSPGRRSEARAYGPRIDSLLR